MSKGRVIGMIWPQFAAYHIDRIEAVAARFAGRAKVIGVEVATRSALYEWAPSGAMEGAEKVTLFPGRSYDEVPVLERVRAALPVLRRCDTVLFGIGYNERDVIILSWLLPLLGVRCIVMSESKFDDFPRSWQREMLKALILSPYRAAIVGARRQHDYLRFLGFRRRPVIPGYDTVGLDRIRRRAAELGPPAPFAERDFLFVGRYVAKKNLTVLVEGYARYVALAGAGARRLVLAGGGPEEPALRAQIARLGIEDRVELTGFLDADAVTDRLSRALALVLVSHEEQWGLVVNEALALGLPAIVSTAVGSRDVLVRNLCNGHVVEPDSPEGIARAMLALADSEESWHAMVAHSHERAWMADTARLADAVEYLVDGKAGEGRQRMDVFAREMGISLT